MSSPSFHVIVPARYGSTRLPGKPLLEIDGRAMILHVIDRAREAGARSVTAATDDERILEVVQGAGFADVRAVMTRPDHPSGSDRVMEAAEHLELPEDAIVVNVQGDEPRVPATIIRQVAGCLSEDPTRQAATVAQPLANEAEANNPNLVKVVCSNSGRALYFSRSVIPFYRDARPSASGWLHHVGIYGFRLRALRRFVSLPIAALERAESLEQLRLLANDIPLQVVLAQDSVPGGVDTATDLARLRSGR